MLKMREKSMPQQQQTFVRVSFDFGYEAEDGKKVSMRENEVLLLINRTNHDWWQVNKNALLHRKASTKDIKQFVKQFPLKKR